MFPYILSAGAIAVAALLAPVASSAASYYVVVPVPKKATTQPEAPKPPLSVSLAAATLPAAHRWAPYSHDLQSYLSVTGDPAFDPAGVVFSAQSVLPPGLTLNANGTLSGTPTDKGSASVEVVATYKDKAGQQLYVLQVGDSLITVTLDPVDALPTGKVGVAYSYNFAPKLRIGNDANPTPGDAVWTASNLPQGLTLTTQGVLSGKPLSENAAGSPFRVQAAYRDKTAWQDYLLAIQPPTVVGQVAYTTAGTFTWTVPAGVSSVSVVAVGGGNGQGNQATSSGTSHFNNTLFAYGSKGLTGGGFAGADGGGAGGMGGARAYTYHRAEYWCNLGGDNCWWTEPYETIGSGGSGGGAGGYTAPGGNAVNGSYSYKQPGYGGGGVGLFGGNAGGAGGLLNAPGTGGSLGANGAKATASPVSGGAAFGGGHAGFGTTTVTYDGVGGGGLGYKNNISVTPGQKIAVKVGTGGAVRIIWPGNERAFPNTRTQDETN